jgi:hypothetical protein
MSQFSRPVETVSLCDALTFYFAPHDHRHARETVGFGWEIVTGTDLDNQGTHTKFQRLPAAFLDGHGESLPLSQAYWYNTQHAYNAPSPGYPQQTLYDREVQRLIWFLGRK